MGALLDVIPREYTALQPDLLCLPGRALAVLEHPHIDVPPELVETRSAFLPDVFSTMTNTIGDRLLKMAA